MAILEHQRLKKVKGELEIIYAQLASEDFEEMDVERLHQIIHFLKVYMDDL